MDNQLSTTALVLIAATGGVGVLLSGLLSAISASRLERRAARRAYVEWLREKKLTAYTDLLDGLKEVSEVGRVEYETLRGGRTANKVNKDALKALKVASRQVELVKFLLPERDRDAVTDLWPKFIRCCSPMYYDVDAAIKYVRRLRFLLQEDLLRTK